VHECICAQVHTDSTRLPSIRLKFARAPDEYRGVMGRIILAAAVIALVSLAGRALGSSLESLQAGRAEAVESAVAAAHR
jgi:hypothetical protein